MSEFDDNAPIPHYTGHRGCYYGGDDEALPLDSATERLFDAIGIAKRRHLRARIRLLISDAVQEAEDNFTDS